MSLLQGCSELMESARLVEELLAIRTECAQPTSGLRLVSMPSAGLGLVPGPRPTAPGPIAAPAAAVAAGPAAPQAPAPVAQAPAPAAHATATATATPAAPVPAPAPASAPSASVQHREAAPAEEIPSFAYRGDRLEFILSSMCRRAGLIGAVAADGKGLPLADFNSPVAGEILAAFTSVLGSALERAGMLLGESGAELISMDINYTDKVVLRRFDVGGDPYFLMVICAQELDERTELELSIEQLIAALSE